MNEKLKKLIFDKLYDDLKNVEIISHEKTNSIWFIDRENKYWYLIYEKTQRIVHWRWDFFSDFFHLFSMDKNEYEPVISEWVEEVLNCKVNTPRRFDIVFHEKVEEVLNCKVNTFWMCDHQLPTLVKEVLNKSYWDIFRKPTSLRS